MELLQPLHTGLAAVVSFLKLLLESLSVLCVCLGLVRSLIMGGGYLRHTSWFLQTLPAMRLQFGSWLALALEFQLGADIIATTINPTLESLGSLGVLALIRTFLNYFLQRELAEQERLVRERLATTPPGETTAAG